MLIYVSGPYTNPSGTPDENIAAAREIAVALWEMGHAVICPHTNTQHFEIDCKAGYDDYIKGDLMMVARCDAMVMTPHWSSSRGAKIEREYAETLGIPVYVAPDLPDLHPTEIRSPLQAKTFAELCGQMYRTHLSKNHDYSPSNILATGQTGLVTRLWDKIARYLNLSGYRVDVIDNERDLGNALWHMMCYLFFVAGFRVTAVLRYIGTPRIPKNESIEDTLMDMAVYALIGLLLRRRVWGK